MMQLSPETVFTQFLAFLDQLEGVGIHYDLKHVRNSLMICVYVPEGLWEIEFFADGTLEAEHFARDAGVIEITYDWLNQFITDQRD